MTDASAIAFGDDEAGYPFEFFRILLRCIFGLGDNGKRSSARVYKKADSSRREYAIPGSKHFWSILQRASKSSGRNVRNVNSTPLL